MNKFYKIWVYSVINDKDVSIMCDEYDTLLIAESVVLNCMSHNVTESYYIIREYETNKNNIIGGDFSTDTGKTVFDSRLLTEELEKDIQLAKRTMVIEQLDSLKENSLEMTKQEEHESVWDNDVIACDIAIDAVKKSEFLFTKAECEILSDLLIQNVLCRTHSCNLCPKYLADLDKCSESMGYALDYNNVLSYIPEILKKLTGMVDDGGVLQ